MGSYNSGQKASGRPQLLYESLSGRIRHTAFDVHRYFGNGFLEKVYENALAHRLEKQGHTVDRQAPWTIRDEDGTEVGHYVPDLVIDRVVLLEIKAISCMTAEHHAQMMNYLKATGFRLGMLLNFGQRKLEIKRFAL